MGRVYLGHDLLLDRPVAIKFIGDALPSAQARQRFRIEAVALARLQHPNVMAVYRAGQVAGQPYIVGELVPGQSLDHLSKPLEWRRALDIALGLARGLAAIHQCGVLHRDLKPGNAILTAEGQVKLVDFGIAKLIGDDGQPGVGSGEPANPGSADKRSSISSSERGLAEVAVTASTDSGAEGARSSVVPSALPALTQEGARLGTPLYMAPEVWNGQPGTARSDVYSLGAMVFELCSGYPPHQAENALTLGWRVMHKDAPPVASIAPSVDGRLAAVVDRCLRRNPNERYASGVELCTDLERLAERLTLRRRLARNGLAGLLLVIGLSVAGNALFGWVRTQRAVSVHLLDAQATIDQARRQNSQVEALRSQAFAAFDSMQPEIGEKLWANSLETSKGSYAAYQQATRSLDAALLLDPRRTDARRQFAEVLYEQAVLFDRDHRDSQRDEMLARLAGYAHIEHAEYLKRWNQPGQLSLTTSPTSVTVQASRYESDAQGRLSLRSLGILGTTPLLAVHLEPGSYLLELKTAGCPVVRAPLLVRRAEPINLNVHLPTDAEIPAGFVYIPAGRFLFGAVADERVRTRILKTVPIHEISTGPYLIARTETTFSDWMDFLNALPSDQGEKRRPRSRAGTSQEQFELRRASDGTWTLTMSPTSTAMQARSGEPIIYTSRTRRRSVDWRRLPVVGIDLSDAQAYVAWLRDTAKVPAARLCTEWEWERAARGADLRDYPHGQVLAVDDANIDITYSQDTPSMGPDEVGSHPASRSPFGVDDLSGNVWEMVLSSLSPNQPLVLRGGAYYYDAVTAQIHNRQPVEKRLRDQRLGLRVCADLAPQKP